VLHIVRIVHLIAIAHNVLLDLICNHCLMAASKYLIAFKFVEMEKDLNFNVMTVTIKMAMDVTPIAKYNLDGVVLEVQAFSQALAYHLFQTQLHYH
jgi:hypothetical protein